MKPNYKVSEFSTLIFILDDNVDIRIIQNLINTVFTTKTKTLIINLIKKD